MSDLQIPHDEIKHTALVGKDNLGARIFHVETIGGAHYILKVDKFGKGSVIAVAPHRAISKTKAEKTHSIQWDMNSDLFKAESDDQNKGIAELVASIKDKQSEIQQLKEINPQAFEAIVGITNELVHILKTTRDVNVKDVQNDSAFESELDSHLKSDGSDDEDEDSQSSGSAHAEKQHNEGQHYAPGAVRNYADGTKAKKQPDGSWKKLPKTGLVTAKSEKLIGGKGDGKSVSDYDPEQVKMGRVVESEHTQDPEKIDEIVCDHLEENPQYYSKLKSAHLADELDKSEDGVPELDKTQPKVRFPEFKDITTRPDQEVHIVKDKKTASSFMKKYLNAAKESRKSPQHQASYQNAALKSHKKLTSGQTAGLNFNTVGGNEKPMSVATAPELRNASGNFNSFGKPLNHPKLNAYKEKDKNFADHVVNANKENAEQYRKFVETKDPADRMKYKIMVAAAKKVKAPRAVKVSLDDYKKEIDKQRKKGSTDPKLIDDVRRMGNAQDRTVEHESLHQMLSTMEKKHGPKFRNQIVSQLLSQHNPEDIQAVAEYVQSKGYKPRTPSFNEEVLAHSRDVLINGDSFKSHLKATKGRGMSDEEKENYARKRINSIKKGHQKVVAYANKLKPEDVVFKAERISLLKSIEASTLMHGDQDVSHDLMNWVYGEDGLNLDGDFGSWVVARSLNGELDNRLVSALNLCVNKHKENSGFKLPVIHDSDTAEEGMTKLLQAKMIHDEANHQEQTLIQPDETTHLILDNQDGTGWYNIGKHLESEAMAMNHDCDTDCRKDDTVISLRRTVEGYHQPLITAVVNNGYITSLKDRHGYKPQGNWEQIKALLLDPAVKGVIEDTNGLHPGFKFQDMPMSMQAEILDVKPGIDTITSKDTHDGIGDAHKDVRDAIEYANVKRSHNPTGWRQDVINDYKAQQAPKMALFTLGQLTSEEYTQLGTN